VGLLVGFASIANAQSVSTLPPDANTPPSPYYGAVLPRQNAHTGVAGSTQSYYPKPGGGQLWKTPTTQSAAGIYPYTSGARPRITESARTLLSPGVSWLRR
jgi:hypothetical protein